MQTELDFQAMQREVAKLYQAGNLNAAIGQQFTLVNKLLDEGSQTLQRQPELSEMIETESDQVIDMLRWQRRFDQAIQLQERLADVFPESAPAYQLSAAQLRVEAGHVIIGLAQLQEMAAQNPDEFWFQISLATSYLWLERFDDAEPILRHSGEMGHVRKIDRALAYQYLFQMYSRQEAHVEDALAAWREAGRLDHNLRAQMLPEVCRMLIYWRQFPMAKKHIAMERNRVRQLFYQALMDSESGNIKGANEEWRTILVDYSPHDFQDAVDEYAEACIRLLNMTTAVNQLEPLIQAGALNTMRLVVLGLAWAQKQDVPKANWYLNMALRLGDSERVRRTRPALQGRILDIHAQLLYTSIVIDPDIRSQIDTFFLAERIG